ncbi:MAG: DNA/RNA non-specific endonuclease [Paludibacteraceae bacterium]|nr:DNA/RNA non-specific endonuclease [Paludibacteraceae bacterium]
MHRLKYLTLLIMLSFHSCSMCSTKRTAPFSADETVAAERPADRAPWWSASTVGYPLIGDSIQAVLLERYCYSVSYNTQARQPNWVMWKLTSDHVRKRKEGIYNQFREDTSLPVNARAALTDYASSGFDKGHMCPGGDCNWDDMGRDETFLLSNICPQNPNLNRGDWKEIELSCRSWAVQYDSIYIVCGPLFLKSQVHATIGTGRIPVPEAFFKVIVCPDAEHPRGIGFICRNTDGNRKKDFYVNSIREVERVTGYRFFPALPDSVRSCVLDMDDIHLW